MTAEFIVEDTFDIGGRLVLLPGFSVSVQVSDEIELHRPDGTVIKTTLRAFEMITRRVKPAVFSAPISVRGVSAGDVPRGTRVVALQRARR